MNKKAYAFFLKKNRKNNDKRTKNPIAKLLQCKIFQGSKIENKKKYTRKEKTRQGKLSLYNPANW